MRPIAAAVSLGASEVDVYVGAAVDGVGAEEAAGGFEYAERQVAALDPWLSYQFTGPEAPLAINL